MSEANNQHPLLKLGPGGDYVREQMWVGPKQEDQAVESNSSRPILRPVESTPIHLSHLHHFVSAYATTEEEVQRLWNDLLEAVKSAKQTRECVIVDHDNIDHIFVVTPSGTVSLYRRVCDYQLQAGEAAQ